MCPLAQTIDNHDAGGGAYVRCLGQLELVMTKPNSRVYKLKAHVLAIFKYEQIEIKHKKPKIIIIIIQMSKKAHANTNTNTKKPVHNNNKQTNKN